MEDYFDESLIADSIAEALGEEETPLNARRRQLVEMAEKSADEASAHCPTAVFLNGRLERCVKEARHKGHCSLRVPAARVAPEKSVEGDLGSLDDLLEWTPEPGPVRDEIMGILAGLPHLDELDQVAELVGKLVGMVEFPGGPR